MSGITAYDREHMSKIIEAPVPGDYDGWDWYTCHVLRLIAKADERNRELLSIIFPEEVEAYREWLGSL